MYSVLPQAFQQEKMSDARHEKYDIRNTQHWRRRHVIPDLRQKKHCRPLATYIRPTIVFKAQFYPSLSRFDSWRVQMWIMIEGELAFACQPIDQAKRIGCHLGGCDLARDLIGKVELLSRLIPPTQPLRPRLSC